MTPEAQDRAKERISRGARAQGAWDEFFGPMIRELKEEYTARIVEIANSELQRDRRADKLTALSNALRITDALSNGMLAIIRDGDLARQELAHHKKVEGMTTPARRLLNISPSF